MEQGVDISMSNWRGFVAPPGISEEARAEYAAIVEEMQATEDWQNAVERNSWVAAYQVDEEFETFLDEEIDTASQIVEELGL